MKRYMVLFLLLCGFVFLQAQTSAFQPANLFNSSSWQGSLLNPSKLHMSNSASFSTTMSNNQSFYQSVYTNHLSYQFNQKLSMNVNLNFVNYGTASMKHKMNFQGNGDNQNKILPEFSMLYQPSKNFTIRFDYQQRSLYSYQQNEDYFWRP
jgi:hypothetical protein